MNKLILLALIFASSAFAQQREPIVIGWSGPLTGNCAVVGVDSVAAVQLVIDKANQNGGIGGRQLKLVVEDDGYITTKAVTAYRKLVDQDKAKVIIANTYGGIFATAAQAVRDQVLVIDPLDCNEEIARLPENTLCLATKTESISKAFSDHIIANKVKSVLLLVEESDGWMQLIAENTRELLEKDGIRVLEEYTPSATASYKSILVKAKNAKVKAIVLLGNDQMGAAVREMGELGIEVQIYGVGSILSPGFQALAAGGLEGALVSSWLAPRTAAYRKFLSQFKEKNGRDPALELATMPSYDVAGMLLSCLRRIIHKGDDISSNAIRQCLLNQKDYPGLTGKISFDRDGAVRSIHERLYRFQGGQLRKNL